MTTGCYVDFCGERHPVVAGRPLVVGREGDVAIDDNPYLHRRFLELARQDPLVWIGNVGSQLSATVADAAGTSHTWLSPGARVPLVFERTTVWFTAGPTTYELDVVIDCPPFSPIGQRAEAGGTTTIGRVGFTPDQRLLVLALAEDILRRGNRGAGAIPASMVAADRLGWTITKFNRKLDNVCQKLSKLGVRGLVGSGERTASARRIRLVEYALAARLITVEDLEHLDAAIATAERLAP